MRNSNFVPDGVSYEMLLQEVQSRSGYVCSPDDKAYHNQLVAALVERVRDVQQHRRGWFGEYNRERFRY